MLKDFKSTHIKEPYKNHNIKNHNKNLYNFKLCRFIEETYLINLNREYQFYFKSLEALEKIVFIDTIYLGQ